MFYKSNVSNALANILCLTSCLQNQTYFIFAGYRDPRGTQFKKLTFIGIRVPMEVYQEKK